MLVNDTPTRSGNHNYYWTFGQCNLLSTSSLFISTQHTWLYSTAKYRIGFLAWFYKMECIWKYCRIIITISKACCSRQSIKDTEAFFSGKVPRQVCNVFYFTWVCSALTKIRKIKTLAIVLKNTAIIQYITIKKKKITKNMRVNIHRDLNVRTQYHPKVL